MRLVKSMKYMSGYRLRLGFEDGSVKDVDLRPHLYGEVFEPLKDIQYFRQVRLHPEMETICWDNDADFAPEFLYEIGVDVTTRQSKTMTARIRRGSGHMRNRRVTGSRLRVAGSKK